MGRIVARNRFMSGSGPIASVWLCPSHFRFSPNSGGIADIAALRIRANCGHRCPLEVKQVTERLIEACYVACTISACQQFGEAAMKVARRQFLHLAAAA